SKMAEFPLPMSEAFLGTFDNPALSQTYRKAVIRPAPSSFTIQIHPPTKQGANYHYGMRVIPLDAPSSPVQSSARSTRTTKSVKGKEYDPATISDDINIPLPHEKTYLFAPLLLVEMFHPYDE
ncbi:10531_t:CDS:2, partial [Acaulospora colombiana]